jgi:hypothetical protein
MVHIGFYGLMGISMEKYPHKFEIQSAIVPPDCVDNRPGLNRWPSISSFMNSSENPSEFGAIYISFSGAAVSPDRAAEKESVVFRLTVHL